ncbi:MAG: lysophospholipid acyltransferase family protein [Bdellovibrionota bacterium]
MRCVRGFFSTVSFICFGVGGLFIGIILFPILFIIIPYKKRQRVMVKVVSVSWKLFVKLMSFFRLISVRIKNKERLSNLKGTVVVANHPSLIDIVLLIAIIPDAVCIVKGKLSKNFFVKHIVRAIYIINDSPETFLTDGEDAIAQGFNVVIFPEGTRTSLGNEKENFKNVKLHRGFAQLAIRSEARILPIKISLSYRILAKEKKWYDVGDKTIKYTLDVLQPILLKESKKNVHSYAIELTEKVKEILFKG